MNAVLMGGHSNTTHIVRELLKAAGYKIVEVPEAKLVYDVIEDDSKGEVTVAVFVLSNTYGDKQAEAIRQITEDFMKPVLAVAYQVDAHLHDIVMTAGARAFIKANEGAWSLEFENALIALKK